MSTDLTKPNPNLPAFAQSQEMFGLDELKQFVVPPRMKIVQKQAKGELLTIFDVGDVISTPANVLISPVQKNDKGKSMDVGTPFTVVPVFFFAEWITWNPIGSEQIIAGRSTDPRSDIARLASNPDTRKDKDTGQRHVEHLNFLVVVDDEDHDMYMTSMIMGFARGEHKSGSKFAHLIRMRKAAICACRYVVNTAKRSNNQGDWFGYDVSIPQENSFVQDENIFNLLKERHFEFKELKERQQVRVDYEEDDAPGAESAEAEKQF